MVLVDSSMWVRAEGRKVSVAAFLPAGEIVAICPAIAQEILQGTSDERKYRLTRDLLMAVQMLDAPVPLERYEEAAQLYLRCRSAGFTVRSSVDS